MSAKKNKKLNNSSEGENSPKKSPKDDQNHPTSGLQGGTCRKTNDLTVMDFVENGERSA